METFKENIISCLKDLKGSGKFISVGTSPFLFPGLVVEGLGEITYPGNETQAKALIHVAHKAAFGKGNKTILDNNIRSAWEIDSVQLTFNGGRWANFLDTILESVKIDLGLEDYTISANLYKMLIYEKGDFFLRHKDSEKEKGMFGTLIIGLPSKHTGGELEVSFEGVEEVASFAEDSDDYKINYAAFYADCDHEIKPLTSGHRICLVYNLIQQKSGKKIQLPSIETHAKILADIFIKHGQNGFANPYIILLGHQYTPENFSMDMLKLNDRSKAATLLQAAQKAGCYAKLCLVTSYLSGTPEDDGRYYEYGDNDGVDEDSKMAEVYDKSLYIEHWLENDVPPLKNISFEEDDLIVSFTLNEEEPIVKEATGYMGNYGPDLMHWYHYGAVMIWLPEVNAQLFIAQDTTTQLSWIDYFSKNLPKTSDIEISTVERLLASGLDKNSPNKNSNFNAIANWIISRNENDFFLNLNPSQCQFYFNHIDATHWLKLIEFFPKETSERIFSMVVQDNNIPTIEHILAVLCKLSDLEMFGTLAKTQIKNLLHYFTILGLNQGPKEFSITHIALQNLIYLEKLIPQDEFWIIQMAELLTSHPKRSYFNDVLVPQLLQLKEITALPNKLLLTCRDYLQERINNQPHPPADWSRQMPTTTEDKKQWLLLKEFLESPEQMVFDYRKNQSDRYELENAIGRVVIDLNTETIKRGSPHILRITKTQATYYKALKNWQEELELLNKVTQKIEKNLYLI